MANVPVPDVLRDELRLSGLAVWEAKRAKKGDPVFVTLAGPGLAVMPMAWGLTLEDAVANALKDRRYLATRPGVAGAMARLDDAFNRLYVALWMEREKVTGIRDLDDDVPF